MIGKSLSERYRLGALSAERAAATLKEMLASHARPLVEVRAQDARMIACLVVRADKPAIRLCRSIGLDVRPGATAVFGLLGADLSRAIPDLSDAQGAWLEEPCGPRETKVLLVAGGLALLSLVTNDGKLSITPGP
jgi:hypothetical protein